MKTKTKLSLKELLLVPIVILGISSFIMLSNGKPQNFISKIFIPTSTTSFEYLKLFFTSMSIILFVEYFLTVEMPPNFFLSRSLALLIMSVVYILFIGFYILLNLKMNVMVYIILTSIVAIVIGQVVSLKLQQAKRFRKGNYIGLFIYGVIAILIIVFTFFGNINTLNIPI